MLTPKATGIRAFTQNKGDLSHPSTPVAQVPTRTKPSQLTPKAPPSTPVPTAPDLTQPSVPTPAIRHGSAMTTASGVSEFQDRIKLAYNKIIEEDSDEEGDEEEGDEDSDRDDISAMMKRAAFNNPTIASPSTTYTSPTQPSQLTTSSTLSEKSRPSRNYKNRLTKNTKYNVDDIFIDDRSVNSLTNNEDLYIPTSQTTTKQSSESLQKSTPLLQKSTKPNLYDLDALDATANDDDDEGVEEGESDDLKELRLIKLYHRQFKILSNLGDYNGAEELLDKAIQLVSYTYVYMCYTGILLYCTLYV